MESKYKQVDTKIDQMGGHWSNYSDNSIGRAIHYIHKVCGMIVAEQVIFHGDGRITLGQEQAFAMVNWTDGYPKIEFEKQNYNDRQAALLKEGYRAFAAPD